MHCGAYYIHAPHKHTAKGTTRARLCKSSPSRNAPTEGAHLDSPREGLSYTWISFITLSILLHIPLTGHHYWLIAPSVIGNTTINWVELLSAICKWRRQRRNFPPSNKTGKIERMGNSPRISQQWTSILEENSNFH